MEIKIDSVSYLNRDNKKVITDFSFDFLPGTIYGLIGPSGSGKSYLGKIIAGLLPITLGEIIYDDNVIKSHSRKEEYNFIINNVGYKNENIETEFMFDKVYTELFNVIKNRKYNIDNRVQDVMKIVGLDDSYINRDPMTLSTGEANKLALAKILLYNPKVIILDEPWIGLDGYEQQQLIKLIIMLKKRANKTIIIITNNLEFLMKVTDEILVLENGKIIKSGSKMDVFKSSKLLKRLNIRVPNTIMFSDLVMNKKNIKMGYRDQVNDLIKDVYRHASWGRDKYE